MSFIAELRDLLEKHDATIACIDNWQGYAECGRDLTLDIDFGDENIEIRGYIDADKLNKLYNLTTPKETP